MKMPYLADPHQTPHSSGGQVVLSSSQRSLSAVNLELESLELFTMECGKGKKMSRLAAADAAALIRDTSLVLVKDPFKCVFEMIKASCFCLWWQQKAALYFYFIQRLFCIAFSHLCEWLHCDAVCWLAPPSKWLLCRVLEQVPNVQLPCATRWCNVREYLYHTSCLRSLWEVLYMQLSITWKEVCL